MKSQTDWVLLAHLISCPIDELLDELERLGLRLVSANERKLEFGGCMRDLTPEHVMALGRRTHEIRKQPQGQPRPSEKA